MSEGSEYTPNAPPPRVDHKRKERVWEKAARQARAFRHAADAADDLTTYTEFPAIPVIRCDRAKNSDETLFRTGSGPPFTLANAEALLSWCRMITKEVEDTDG